jgi:thiol-disulfide isomerase/thioredoxin
MFKNKIIYFCLIFLITCFFYNCKKQAINDLPGTNNEKNNIQKVIITGTSDDAKFFKYFNLLGLNYTTQFKSEDSLYITTSLKKAKFINLVAFGDTFISTPVFISPKDSIFLKVKDKKVKFKGKNAAHYNFFIEIDSLKLKQPIYKENLRIYKQSCIDNFNKKTTFFKHYTAKNKELSKDFQLYIEGWLQFEYLNNLIVQTKEDGTTVYISDLKTNLKNNEDYDSYFDNISIENFKNPKLLEVAPYYNALTNYIRYYFTDNHLDNFSSEKFIKEKDFILNNLSESIQSFAISRLIFLYYRKNRLENKENIQKLIASYKHNFTEPNLIKNIQKIENSLKTIKSEFTNSALDSKLLTINGDTIRFKDILEKGEGKINVIDFWASWCRPCISEIKKGKENRIKLTLNDDVEWTYISIDDDIEKWEKKSKELAEYGLLKKQYLVLNRKESALISALKVKEIPRYTILNKKAEIIDYYAPRPSDSIVFKKIIDNINFIK